MAEIRIETDSLGEVEVPADKLWGAQTQRSLRYFSIGHDLMPREMIGAYATLKRAAATANQAAGRPMRRPPILSCELAMKFRGSTMTCSVARLDDR
jgi:fumarate hydratase class II